MEKYCLMSQVMAATETIETLTQNYVEVPACTHLKV